MEGTPRLYDTLVQVLGQHQKGALRDSYRGLPRCR